MTKLQTMQRKYGNAVRAVIGNINTKPRLDDQAKASVQRWEDRLNVSGRELPKVTLFALLP